MRRKIIYTILALILIGGFLFWKLSPGVSKEKSNVRGIMTGRLNYVPSSNSNADKYISELQEQIKDNSSNSSLYNMLGGAYLQKARETSDPEFYSLAEVKLKKAIELEPKNFEAMYLMGTLCLARHQFTAALEWGNKSIDLNPYNGPICGVIFDAQIELGRYDEALQTIQAMVDLRPDMTSFSRVSYYRELKGDITGAIDAMQSAINAGAPNSENRAWCMVQLGNLFLNNGEQTKAENCYQEALTEYPMYWQGLTAMGKLQFIRNDNNGAIQFYKKSIEVNPTAEAMIALGDVYKITGQNDKAEEQYQNVRFMNTLLKQGGVNVDMELALFEADHNTNLEEPLKNALESIEKAPTIKSYNTLAWIQYKRGNYTEAAKNITSALRLGTKEPLLYYHAGLIFAKIGENEKAKKYLEYALKINHRLPELYQ
jgi:tetratricopeptide (TPR) repeat protein